MQPCSLESSSPFSKCWNVVCSENSSAGSFVIWWVKTCSMDSEVASSFASLINYFNGSVEVSLPEQSAWSFVYQSFCIDSRCFPSVTFSVLSAACFACRGFVTRKFACINCSLD